MKLYRIRRKSDGKYFAGWISPWNSRYRGRAHWYDKGAFYQRVDTVKAHLEALASDWDFAGGGQFKPDKRIIRKKFPARLKLYEIVVNNVTLNDQEIIQATDLVRKK